MRRGRTAAVVAAAMLVLAGCAIPEVPYDRETAGGIHRIGVVTPQIPHRPAVVLATSVGKNLGLIGGLGGAALQSDREAKFKQLLDQRNFLAEAVFTQGIAAGLQARGYEVVMVPLTRDKSDFAASYPAEPSVDAYLDIVTTGYGYVAAGIGSDTPYRPVVVVKVRLTQAKGSTILMQDTV